VVVGSVTEACALPSGAGSALETMLTPQGDHRLRGSVSQGEREENHVLEITGIEVALSAFETLPERKHERGRQEVYGKSRISVRCFVRSFSRNHEATGVPDSPVM
jgi:ribonuclease HI